MGDRNIGRDKVQDLGTDIGKIVRIDRDGKPPAGQPVPEEVRRAAGAVVDGPPQRAGRRAQSRNGRTLDERTRTERRRRTQSHARWPQLRLAPGDVSVANIPARRSPIAPRRRAWNRPCITGCRRSPRAACCSTRASGFRQWRGNVFVGALAAKELVRLEMDGNRVVHEERLLRRGAEDSASATSSRDRMARFTCLTDEARAACCGSCRVKSTPADGAAVQLTNSVARLMSRAAKV